MNLAEFSINKKVVTWALTAVLVVAGLMVYQNLPRLEDPEFTIKEAIVATPYPGASAEEVEQEVTDMLETEIQKLGQLWWIESTSMRGQSIIKARIKDKYDKNGLPQVWDELRRKVNEAQVKLPPGAGPSSVDDDFGDVYGVYVVLTGEGYSYAQLRDVAKLLRKELLLVQDVKRVVLWGEEKEAVYVEMSRPKMAALEISPNDVYNALAAKNLASDGGRVQLGTEYIPINPTGEFQSEQEFGDLLIKSRGGDRLVFLKDVATIRRGYVEPPAQIVRYDGQQGIALGISSVAGGNVVTMGEGLSDKIDQLMPVIPLGIEAHIISLQSDAVTTAISGFVISLIEAIIIVIAILLFFMGLRSALIIGGILLLTICGTFLFMGMAGVTLERISLGALIIALGMLVDNAIVIIDGMKVRIEAGMDRTKAAIQVVGQNAVPLFGATVVAVIAFAAIGTSQDATGEYCRSLFTVVLIALMLSWVTAVTTTPLVGFMFLKGKKEGKKGEAPKDPYAGKFYQVYKKLLKTAIKQRWVTVGVVVALFVSSLWGFGFVSNMFFPDSTRPQFFIDVFFPEGTHIRTTEAQLAKAEEYLNEIEGVTGVGTAIGGGDLRFLLTYTPNPNTSSFGVLFVDVDDYKKIAKLAPMVQKDLSELLPEAVVNTRFFRLGPGAGGRLQLRITGSDRATLRHLGEKAEQIFRDAGAQGVRSEWQQKVKVVRPQLAEAQARRLGIDRPEVTDALLQAYEGKRVGVYREKDELIPIIARAPQDERVDLDQIEALQIWSPAAGRMVPMRQVMTGYETTFEDARIWRRNRMTTYRVHCDPPPGVLPSTIMATAKPDIEEALNVDLATYFGKSYKEGEDPFAKHKDSTIPYKDQDQIPLKDYPGYFMAWGGENEDSSRAQGALATTLPIFLAIMVLTVLFLFNSVRLTLVIWLTVPLSIIGVTLGLLVFNQPFGFMALLGLMSLWGMLIKNSIVLIEEIQSQMKSGKDRFVAVVDAGLSRMMPVAMAALTTILGMLPLLTDAFFVAMAVTIMVGLGVATLLTLVIVPVLYCIVFRVPSGGDQNTAAEEAA
jgi:multidrug efflux pump subunit AcrB